MQAHPHILVVDDDTQDSVVVGIGEDMDSHFTRFKTLKIDKATGAIARLETDQSLEDKWVAASSPAKRQLLKIVCLNCTLVGASLVPQIRKPFDVLAEGLLVSSSRGDRRWTFPNDLDGRQLFHAAIAQVVEFDEVTFYEQAMTCT